MAQIAIVAHEQLLAALGGLSDGLGWCGICGEPD